MSIDLYFQRAKVNRKESHHGTSMPLKVRQQRLGHSDPSLTLGVYTHVVSEDDVRIAAQLDAVLRGVISGEEKVQTDEVLRPNAPKKENGSEGASSKPLYLN